MCPVLIAIIISKLLIKSHVSTLDNEISSVHKPGDPQQLAIISTPEPSESSNPSIHIPPT